jgi:hypothetical protein
MKNIIIIGSGIAGLAAANYLSSKNFNVTVLDKGKYPGGRISTRRGKDFIFNHGAQFFTAKSNAFKNICKRAVNDNVLVHWEKVSKKNRYIGNPDMREFSFWLSKNLSMYQDTFVERLDYNDQFIVYTNNKKFICDGLIITAPSFQTASLIKNLDQNICKLIEKVEYFPCWCVMLSIKDLSLKNFNIDEKSIFNWIVSENNKIKNQLNHNCLTIHTNERFSVKNLEKTKEVTLDKIVQEFTKIYQVKTQDIIYKNIHKWRYAKVKKPFPQEESKISKKIPFGIAGDWCPPSQDRHYNANGQRVEDAYLSGIECSKSLIKQYF